MLSTYSFISCFEGPHEADTVYVPIYRWDWGVKILTNPSTLSHFVLNLYWGILVSESMLLTLLAGGCTSKWAVRWDWGMIFKKHKILWRFNNCLRFLAAKVPNFKRGVEGEMYGKGNMETCITIHKIDSQWEFAVGSGNSNRGPVSIWRGGMGREMGERFKREGINVYLWLIHTEVWQKTTKFCKTIILQ